MTHVSLSNQSHISQPTVCKLSGKYDKYLGIYPSRRHNSPPTLEIIIQNFPKISQNFQKFSIFSKIFQNVWTLEKNTMLLKSSLLTVFISADHLCHICLCFLPPQFLLTRVFRFLPHLSSSCLCTGLRCHTWPTPFLFAAEVFNFSASVLSQIPNFE